MTIISTLLMDKPSTRLQMQEIVPYYTCILGTDLAFVVDLKQMLFYKEHQQKSTLLSLPPFCHLPYMEFQVRKLKIIPELFNC